MIINGDCLEEMRKMEDNSISAIVTDPPYGLSFMGKGWDYEVPGIEYWRECLRITKPGGFALVMGGTRTFHRLASGMEDSGWEIRDTIMWLYGSGFPKSHNHFGIEGYGTALKPAYEPIIMAMKPCEGTFKQNAEKWGQAGINIDECRIGFQSEKEAQKHSEEWDRNWTSSPIHAFDKQTGNHPGQKREIGDGPKPQRGRWPANVIFDEEAAKMLDEQSGTLKSGSGDKHSKTQTGRTFSRLNSISGIRNYESDSGGASRFFYCAKASSSERNEGLEEMPDIIGKRTQDGGDDTRGRPTPINKNSHPTVKPLKLMQYLIKLVMPPKDGVLLDPFAGSGTTILAAHQLGVKAIGIEKSAEYCEIARARIENYKPEEKEADLFDCVEKKLTAM